MGDLKTPYTLTAKFDLYCESDEEAKAYARMILQMSLPLIECSEQKPMQASLEDTSYFPPRRVPLKESQ